MNSRNENLVILSFAVVLGLYCISFLWNFWSHGYTTLGIGASFFGLLTLGFFIFTLKKSISIRSLTWIIPMILIMLSLGIYTNPFIKIINIICIPFLYVIFTTHETKKVVRETLWSKLFLPEFFAATLRITGSFFKSIPAIGNLTKKEMIMSSEGRISQREAQTSAPQKTYSAHKQIVIGLGIFAILAVTIVIPLLSSADPRFATLFEKIIDYFISFVSLEGLVKALFVIGVTCTFFGYRLYWQKNYKPFVEITQQTDTKSYSPMIGTILIGLLGLYGLFLFLQAQNLFASALPNDFKVTETLVKSGFWQLLALTALNTVLYTTIFGKTIRWVQYILGAFTIASLLLLFSAVQRVYLYVTVYGLSYEKFFAFYTVLFCVGMFTWFIYLMVTKKKDMPIFKTLCFSALWFYAAATIFPMERFVLSTNLAMTKNENSRIDLNELQMLSFDAVRTFDSKTEEILIESEADKLLALGDLREQQPGIYLTRQNKNVSNDWTVWREKRIKRMSQITCHTCNDEGTKKKKWYEKTLTELLHRKPSQALGDTDVLTTWNDPYNGYSLMYKSSQVYGPYSEQELSTGQVFENAWESMQHRSYHPTALSIERFYFKNFNSEKPIAQYRLDSNARRLSTKEQYDTLLSNSPNITLDKSIARPYLHTSQRNEELVFALYVDAPNGYFIISPTQRGPGSTPITQETKMPDSLDEFIKINTLSNGLGEALSTFTLINQDFSI